MKKWKEAEDDCTDALKIKDKHAKVFFANLNKIQDD